MGDYGEFKEVIEGQPVNQISDEQANMVARVRMPKKGEFIGVIIQRYGGNRMEVHTTDGKKRNCRVPGKYKRDLWLRPKDIVLVAPWIDDDDKGDIIYKYNGASVSQLRRKGILNTFKDDF